MVLGTGLHLGVRPCQTEGSQLRVGMVLGTGLHRGVRPCQTEGVTAQVGMVLGTGLHLGVRPCQTEGHSSGWEYYWVQRYTCMSDLVRVKG